MSKLLRERIISVLKDEEVGNEIFNRLSISQTPKNKEDAIKILKKLNPELNDKIALALKISLGTYDHGECGEEIARKINGCVDILKSFVNGNSLELAKDRMGSDLMDKIVLEALTLSLNSIEIAKNFEKYYDQMISVILDIEPSKTPVKDKEEVQKITQPPNLIRKRIRLRR